MRIDERERGVAGERDPLSGRAERGAGWRRRGKAEFARQRVNARAIDMGLDEIGDFPEPGLQPLRLAGLHEAEMALVQRKLIVARQRADDGSADALDRLRDQPA